MNTFFWYSKGSKESGTFLANAMEIAEHGTNPPKNFKGTLICYGAKPSDKFKWDSRVIRAILNDPRKVRQYLDRKVVFDKLAEQGINVVSCETLAEEAQYANLCNLLGVPLADGFVVGQSNGLKSRTVTSQAELTAAIADGCTRAFDPKFTSTSKIRVFVVNGNVVGAAHKTGAVANEAFFARAAEDIADDLPQGATVVMAEGILKSLVLKKTVVPSKSYWGPFGALTQAIRTCAINSAQALEMDFCAVDILVGPNGPEVINVVTTPNLREVPSVQAAIINGFNSWLAAWAKSSKEILKELADEASDEEAEALLEKLRELKGEFAAAAG